MEAGRTRIYFVNLQPIHKIYGEGNDMNPKALAILFAALVAAAIASGKETVVFENVLGAEGPLFLDGNLYYVGWVSNTLSKWDGKKSTVLNNAPGCSHNGLALTREKTFLLACTDERGAILELDLNGKEL